MPESLFRFPANASGGCLAPASAGEVDREAEGEVSAIDVAAAERSVLAFAEGFVDDKVFTAALAARRNHYDIHCLCGRFAKYLGGQSYYNGTWDCYRFSVRCSRCGEVTIECV